MKKVDDNNTLTSNKKRHMHINAIIGAIVIFAVIIIGMFVFAFLKKEEIQQEVLPNTPLETVQAVPYPLVTRIDAKHYYINGIHTLVGEVELPTPCDLLETQSTVQESYPEKVTIAFSVLNNSDTCAQKITQQRFKVSATASEEAQIQATFMGRPIELNLIPAREGETPDEFELFLKG